MTLRDRDPNPATDEPAHDPRPEQPECEPEQIEGEAVKTCAPRVELRPELRKLFEEIWKRDEAGFRFLADR